MSTINARRDHVELTPVPAHKRRRGRPTDYLPEMVDKACFMARHGATDVEMAHELGVNISTFYLWMNQHPEFSEALKEGKAAYDAGVEQSLGRRARGYDIETEKVFANGQRMKVIEHIPPDTAAAFIWLKNRKRLDWKDRHETAIVIPEDAQGVAGEPSNRQLAMAVLALLAEARNEANEETIDGRTTNSEAAPSLEDEGDEEGEIDPDFDLDE